MPLQLPENIYNKVVACVNKAKAENVAGEYEDALELYRQAETLFPEPAEQYTGACMLYCLLAETLLQLKKEDEAFVQYNRAASCADGVNDAKISYQLGLYHLHRGNEKPALQHLQKAYRAGGEEVFTSRAETDRTFFKQHIFQRTIAAKT